MAQVKSTPHELPPYVSYSTFKNTLAQLREGKSLPTHIDASVLQNLSGSSRAWLITALRYLGLITSDNRPTDKLKELHKATPEDEKKIFKAILGHYYPTLVEQLPNGTAISLRNAFPVNTSDPMKRKCIRFFVSVAKDSGLTISPHILKGTPVRQPKRRRVASTVRQKRSSRIGGTGGELQEDESPLPAGFKRLPFPVGLKVWQVQISEDYSDDDVIRFTEMVKMALLRKKSRE